MAKTYHLSPDGDSALPTPMLDLMRDHAADKLERFMALNLDLGFVEPLCDGIGGHTVWAPTAEFCKFIGLDQIGVTIENGEWVVDFDFLAAQEFEPVEAAAEPVVQSGRVIDLSLIA